jgi:hypothetical protein
VVFRLPEQNSIIVSLGSINIIDATVIEAKQSRKRKGKNGNNTQDPEADYNVKIAADGKRLICSSSGSSKFSVLSNCLKRQMVEWSGTASLRLKSMKRLNIKSLAINTQQNSFADSLVIEHKSLSELDDVHNIINWGEIEQTLSNLSDWWFFGWVMQRSLVVNLDNNFCHYRKRKHHYDDYLAG